MVVSNYSCDTILLNTQMRSNLSHNIIISLLLPMLSTSSPIMQIQEHTPTFDFLFQSKTHTQQLRFDLKKLLHRIFLGRKEPKTQLKDTDIRKIINPHNPRLSSDHAYITIRRKNIEIHLKILDHVLKQKLPGELLKIIINYLYSDFDVTVRDLGSNCGTYIPKNRLFGIQQFWVLDQWNQERNLSFGVYFLSTPGEFQGKLSGNHLMQYLQRCEVICDNSQVLDEALGHKSDLQEVSTKILSNYAVAVLSHEQKGYIFIKDPKKQMISIAGHFVAEIVEGKLKVESKMMVYSNICNEKKNKENKYSDAFRIKARECLVIGEERCYLTIKE